MVYNQGRKHKMIHYTIFGTFSSPMQHKQKKYQQNYSIINYYDFVFSLHEFIDENQKNFALLLKYR